MKSAGSAIGSFFKSVGKSYKDIKDKAVQGLKSLENWVPGGKN